MDDFADCIETFEQNKAELERLEGLLAKECRLRGLMPTRRALLLLDLLGELDHSPLVADWKATYARFLDWEESVQGPGPRDLWA